MKPSITFALNDVFKDSNDDMDAFWAVLLDNFKFAVDNFKWPRAQHPERVIVDLRPFFEYNNVYDLLRKDDEDIRLVIQETGPHSGMTLKMAEEMKGIFPKSPWFIQRQPKMGNWKEKMPLQNTFIFPWPVGDGSHCMWGDTRQADGIVHIVQKVRPTERGLTPSPVDFNQWEPAPIGVNTNLWGS